MLHFFRADCRCVRTFPSSWPMAIDPPGRSNAAPATYYVKYRQGVSLRCWITWAQRSSFLARNCHYGTSISFHISIRTPRSGESQSSTCTPVPILEKAELTKFCFVCRFGFKNKKPTSGWIAKSVQEKLSAFWKMTMQCASSFEGKVYGARFAGWVQVSHSFESRPTNYE